jgi:hypothetical protein
MSTKTLRLIRAFIIGALVALIGNQQHWHLIAALILGCLLATIALINDEIHAEQTRELLRRESARTSKPRVNLSVNEQAMRDAINRARRG